MHHHHPLPFGAELQADGSTRFRIWAPSVPSLTLQIAGHSHAMVAEEGDEQAGWFSLTLPAPAGTRYRYILPDGLAVPDPASRLQAGDVHDESVVVDPGSYTWRNTAWLGRPWHETVLYELHAGVLGGYPGVMDRLPELAALGITAIELMPLSDFPGPRNWGYDGVLPFAPDASYGTPDELKAMIDAAHGLGMMVFLDVVYNHFGPDGAYLHTYAKSFFRDDMHTPWGAAIDFRRPEVCEYFTHNALYWLHEYRFDGLRFDAVAQMSEAFLFALAASIRLTTEPGREVHLVCEHEDNRAALLRGPAPHFDAQWTDDIHHVLHVLLTGETEGYYSDYADATAHFARCLAGGFAFQGEYSQHGKKIRGESSAGLPTTAFVAFLQNHDQTGNRAMGERLTTLTSPARLEAATRLLLTLPFIPLLFMGDEYATEVPFLFFTSHGDDLAELVRRGRRSEFKHFAAFQDASRRDQIPDPNDPATFERSTPDRADPARYALIQSLLAFRRHRIVPGLPGCMSLGADILGPSHVRAAWRMGNGERLTIDVDLGDTPHFEATLA